MVNNKLIVLVKKRDNNRRDGNMANGCITDSGRIDGGELRNKTRDINGLGIVKSIRENIITSILLIPILTL